MAGVWMSKGPGRRSGFSAYVVREGTTSIQTAHYIEDGQPLCAKAVMKDGTPLLAEFLSSWVELRPFNRRCKICQRMGAPL